MAMDVSGMRAPSAPGPMGGDTLSWDPFRNFFTNYGQVVGLHVNRRDNGYTVEIPAAGFKPEEISVTLDDGVLTVTGQNDKRQFTRSLLLPEEIDSDNIQAKVENGLLTLTLNMHPKAQPKKIEVAHN
jgi:HSP20 family molecular chaperone IbpA